MENELFEGAKKIVAERSYEDAVKFIWDLARNRRITFTQYVELNKINFLNCFISSQNQNYGEKDNV